MESTDNKMIEKTEYSKNNCLNGGIDNNIAKLNDLKSEKLSCNIKSNNYMLNILPKTRRVLNDNKLDKKFTTNSSFLAFRKYSNGNLKKVDKKYDNTATINENNINIMSISNMSNSKFLNEKNENEIRNFLTPKLKDETDYSPTINKINSIYENNFTLKLKTNQNTNDIANTQCKNKNNKLLTIEYAKYNTNLVKKNSFIIKSRTFNNDLENSLIFDKHSSKILQRFCFICEVFEEKLYHTRLCSHLFCKKCGRSYFEQLVEKGIYNIKCPKYNCHNNLNLKDLKEILTPDTYQKIQTYIKIDMKFDNNKGIINNRYKSIDKGINDINLNLIKKNMAKLANHDSFKVLVPKKKHSLKSQIPISNKNDYAMHFRVKQHFIKLTNSKKFIIKVKNEKDIKKVVCMKCKKSSLFSREDQNFIRCLNCGNVICKYCFKQLGEKNNNGIRKLNTIYAICYNHIKIPTKKSKPKRIIYQILFIISGFLILWIGFSKYEAKYIINKRKRHLLFVIFFSIFLMLNLVIFILFIPYFPLIVSILE